MALRRYSRTTKLASGTRYGTSDSVSKIRSGITQGILDYKVRVIAQGERLDTVAGQEYKDATLWWVIAAASNIGWAPQVPPGTVLLIPTSLSAVERVISA